MVTALWNFWSCSPLGASVLVADIGYRSLQEGTVGQISQLVAASIGFASLYKEPFIPVVSA